MRNGILERQKDADTLMNIYNKIDARGYVKEPLTTDEQVLIFCLAKWLRGGKDEETDRTR